MEAPSVEHEQTCTQPPANGRYTKHRDNVQDAFPVASQALESGGEEQDSTLKHHVRTPGEIMDRSTRRTSRGRDIRQLEETDGSSSSNTSQGESQRARDRMDRGDEMAVSRNSRHYRQRRDYRRIVTKGKARSQLGDTYIEQQTIYGDASAPGADRRDARAKEVSGFMDNLEFDHMFSRLATIGPAQLETCCWLFTAPEYLRWQEPACRESNNGFLWIKGKPGAGKSTIMKHALRHAQDSVGSDDAVFSFFFNARGCGPEKNTEGMYRSLLHQLYSRFPERLPRPLPPNSAALKRERWPVPMLQNMLRDALLGLKCKHDLFWYIDALDECEEDDIRLAVQHFEGLAVLATLQKIKLFVCFASRHYPRITISRHEMINLDTEEGHQKDIAIYVKDQLRDAQALTYDLSEEILRRSCGVFLWAALVVQFMNKTMDRGATRSQLLAGLRMVPDGIEELLKTMMLDGDPALLPALQWVLFSRRNLQADELYFAIMTSIGRLSTALQDAAETSEEQMRSFILTSSRGLVEFTNSTVNSNSTAEFIHETVREHLLSSGLAALDSSLSDHVEGNSHARLGRWCQDCIREFASSMAQQSSFMVYSMRYMITHMEIAYSSKALKLLAIDDVPQRTWDLVKKHLGPGTGDSAPTSLYILIRFHCTELAEAILQRQAAYYASIGDQDQGATPSTMVKSGVSAIDVNTLCGGSPYHTALLTAISYARRAPIDPPILRVVKLLLDCGANPNLAVRSGHTPLLEALNHKREFPDSDLVELLLRHGADPNMPISSKFGPSALAVAVQWDDEKLVESLLQFGANARGQSKARPLCLAAAKSSPSIVRLLLAAGASADDRSDSGRTALHEIITRNGKRNVRITITQALLDARAKVDAVDDGADTALTLAFGLGRYGLAKLLLDRGADPNMPQHRDIARELPFRGDGYSDWDPLDSDSSIDSFTIDIRFVFSD